MDYLNFVQNYHDVTKLPIDLLQNGVPVWSSAMEVLHTENAWREPLFSMEHNPSFCGLPGLDYGRIHIENTDYDIIVGPAFGIPVTHELIRSLLRALMLPATVEEAAFDFFSAMPVVTHAMLGRHMQLIFQAVNGYPVSAETFYGRDDLPTTQKETSLTQDYLQTIEEASYHNTYVTELQLYEKIKSGNTTELRRFMENPSFEALWNLTLAKTPLRNARNIFISLTSRASMIGAVPGGMDVEKACQLTEYYIQECEELSSIEAIANLSYSMLMDFCERVGAGKAPGGHLRGRVQLHELHPDSRQREDHGRRRRGMHPPQPILRHEEVPRGARHPRRRLHHALQARRGEEHARLQRPVPVGDQCVPVFLFTVVLPEPVQEAVRDYTRRLPQAGPDGVITPAAPSPHASCRRDNPVVSCP
jgi:hypothetical protein